jgi:hypothetical protein
MVDPAAVAAIKKKYVTLHTQLIRTRDSDLRTLETKRKADLSVLETKHKNDVEARKQKFLEDSLNLNAQEKDEIDALNP